MVDLPFDIDPRAYFILVREESEALDHGGFEELDDDGLREWRETFCDPSFGISRLEDEFRDGVLWVFAGAVVDAVVDSSGFLLTHRY